MATKKPKRTKPSGKKSQAQAVKRRSVSTTRPKRKPVRSVSTTSTTKPKREVVSKVSGRATVSEPAGKVTASGRQAFLQVPPTPIVSRTQIIPLYDSSSNILMNNLQERNKSLEALVTKQKQQLVSTQATPTPSRASPQAPPDDWIKNYNKYLTNIENTNIENTKPTFRSKVMQTMERLIETEPDTPPPTPPIRSPEVSTQTAEPPPGKGSNKFQKS